MKNVQLIQVGFDFDGAVYLPYAVGTLQAYSQQFEDIRRNYSFSEIIFRRDNLKTTLDRMTPPDIAAFSCNVWNMEYNKALAQCVKKKYPSCLVLFGGHSVGEDGSLLKDEPYIDILMFGEGEELFAQLLRALPDGSLYDIPNIAFRNEGNIIKTERKYYNNIDGYPSPYLTGIFDPILEKNPGTDFLSVLETNRGCPYSCAYCDWCAGKKVRQFPMEKVLDEIKWLAVHKIEYCFCADSNFGMLDRDLEIARALVESKKKYGYPKVFRPCYEKNSDSRVFEICSLLNSVGMDKGATMAYQTLSPEALANVGRKNLTMEHFASLLRQYNKAGIPTYSELILGLPGETKESFCEGICRLFENGQHNSVSVYHCEVLPNSDLSVPEYVQKHGIEIMKVAFNHIHSANGKKEEIPEYSYLVRSTATMNRDDWVYANLFSVCVQCFHSLGVLRLFAMYLHNEKKSSYLAFYTALLSFILNESDGKLHEMWNTFKKKYESSLAGDWNYHNEKFGNVTWFFEEGAFLEIISDLDPLFSELIPFLRRYDFELAFFSELSAYQKAILRKMSGNEKTLCLHYDFPAYFEAITNGNYIPLEQKSCTVCVRPQTEYANLADYARETVWYGRRRGATVLKKNEIMCLCDD